MRKPDLCIGPRDDPQTLRWHLVKFLGVQIALHKWMRSDGDRAPHDHSSHNISIILSPHGYREWLYEGHEPYAVMRRRWLVPYFRRAEQLHRVELRDARPVWTLWIRFAPFREWGFFCVKGWVHWRVFLNEDYTVPGSESTVGRGCD